MTPRERVLAAMRRTALPDRCPFEISWGAFTPGLMKVYRERTGSTVEPCEHFDFDTRSVNVEPTRMQTDFRRFYAHPIPEKVVFDEWGVGMVPGSFEHFVEFKYHPLAACETPEQVSSFAWPDVDADYRFEPLAARVADYQARGYAVTGELYQTIFEMAWLLRGFENLLMDFLADPALAHVICERLTELRITQAVRYAELGVDILRLGDDVGTQAGPMLGLDVYRTFLKERTRRIIAAAKRVKPDLLVFMHCDGQVSRFIPEYLEIGVDILNPVQPECNDLAAIGRQYGDRLSFWGGIGTQSAMPFGTPEDIRRIVCEVKSALGSRGGLLVAPTHILEPEVPWANVEAFVAAAKSARYSPAAAPDLPTTEGDV
jgi:uroporphyrinogen decarboxylase